MGFRLAHLHLIPTELIWDELDRKVTALQPASADHLWTLSLLRLGWIWRKKAFSENKK